MLVWSSVKVLLARFDVPVQQSTNGYGYCTDGNDTKLNLGTGGESWKIGEWRPKEEGLNAGGKASGQCERRRECAGLVKVVFKKVLRLEKLASLTRPR